MAKLVIFGVPAHGHVNPTLPVIAELARRGHQILYCNAPSFEQAISRSGAALVSYPDSAASEADFARRADNLAGVSVHLLQETLRLLPFTLDLLRREQPDLVMFDSLALWGMQATLLHPVSSVASITTLVQEGVPGIVHWRDYPHLIRQALPHLATLRRLRKQLVNAYGARIFPRQAIFPCTGDRNLVYTSRAFQPDTPFIDDTFHFVGPSILEASRAETEFPWDAMEPGRKKIYVSLGTVYTGTTMFYRAVIDALAGHPAQVILSIGRQMDLRDLGVLPDNFIVRPHVPQLKLLQKVDLFVTHGGMNSVNEGLNYGLPLVVVPQQLEQALNGRQVARQGAGVVLADAPPYGRIDAVNLRRTVDRVLMESEFRINAERLSRSFREAGGYQRAADLIASAMG
ncbi:MAG: macrolide family glycosyltransferase [Thermoflexales bacterium]